MSFQIKTKYKIIILLLFTLFKKSQGASSRVDSGQKENGRICIEAEWYL